MSTPRKLKRKFGEIVFLPVMPIGVEHNPLIAATTSPKKVFLPVMPIGVEHLTVRYPKDAVVVVFLPVMPIGVEHR